MFYSVVWVGVFNGLIYIIVDVIIVNRLSKYFVAKPTNHSSKVRITIFYYRSIERYLEGRNYLSIVSRSSHLFCQLKRRSACHETLLFYEHLDLQKGVHPFQGHSGASASPDQGVKGLH
ncbi:hypothetical protein D3C87_1602200 [compost metagenome]